MKEQKLSKKMLDIIGQIMYNKCVRSGDDGIEVTLLPIPNRTVKVYSADGTAWETVWKSRTSPDILVYSRI